MELFKKNHDHPLLLSLSLFECFLNKMNGNPLFPFHRMNYHIFGLSLISTKMQQLKNPRITHYKNQERKTYHSRMNISDSRPVKRLQNKSFLHAPLPFILVYEPIGQPGRHSRWFVNSHDLRSAGPQRRLSPVSSIVTAIKELTSVGNGAVADMSQGELHIERPLPHILVIQGAGHDKFRCRCKHVKLFGETWPV